MITLENVSFGYGAQPALVGVSARVARGELAVVVGPNGAGKSTLLRLAAGLLAPQQGAMEIAGRAAESWEASELARVRAYVPQDNAVRFPFSVYEVVLMGRAPHAGRFVLETPRDREQVRSALAELELEPLAHRSVDSLSGGERQRVALARALAQQPQLFILDEPEAHLDLRHRLRCFELLQRRCARGATALLASHDLSLAAGFADRLLVLHGGRVVAHGRPDAVLDPTRLREVFGVAAELLRHPRTGRPCLVYDVAPASGADERAAQA